MTRKKKKISRVILIFLLPLSFLCPPPVQVHGPVLLPIATIHFPAPKLVSEAYQRAGDKASWEGGGWRSLQARKNKTADMSSMSCQDMVLLTVTATPPPHSILKVRK